MNSLLKHGVPHIKERYFFLKSYPILLAKLFLKPPWPICEVSFYFCFLMEMVLAIWFSRHVQQKNPNGLVCRFFIGAKTILINKHLSKIYDGNSFGYLVFSVCATEESKWFGLLAFYWG